MIGRSTSHFQSPFSPSVLAVLCVCEEARGGGIGVGKKVGHSRFCLVARQNSRLTLTPMNGGRVSRLTDAATLSMLVLQICVGTVVPLPCWLPSVKPHDTGFWSVAA